VGEESQARREHSHNYPGTKKSAVLIPPSAEQQWHLASREFTAWELIQRSPGAFFCLYWVFCLVCLLLTYRAHIEEEACGGWGSSKARMISRLAFQELN